jgi:hypothetical protein
VVTELGVNASAITYWVSESDHVVTTVAIRLDQDKDTNNRGALFRSISAGAVRTDIGSGCHR